MATDLKDKEQLTAIPEDYQNILSSLSSKTKSAQARAMSLSNRELIEVYREIGKTITEQQDERKWGSSVVERLAVNLQKSFPGMKGFSSRNLWRMKDFYQKYKENEKLTTLSSEISWSHNVAILSKCRDSLEIEFYMKMGKRNGWSYRVLIHQIEVGSLCLYK